MKNQGVWEGIVDSKTENEIRSAAIEVRVDAIRELRAQRVLRELMEQMELEDEMFVSSKIAFEAIGESELYDYEAGIISQIDSINTDRFNWDINNIKKIYKENKDIYERLSLETGFSPELIAAIHYRESRCDFNAYLHNGDKLGEPTINVPAGILFYEFELAAIDALLREEWNISMSSDTRDMAAISVFAELYNGLGYKKYHDSVSPYVYSGTNVYTSGKYTSDGKYNSNVIDAQPGIYLLVIVLQEE